MLVRILFLSLLTSVTLATEIEIAEPERTGLSSDRLKRVTELVQRYVETGRAPGIQVMVNRGGKILFNRVVGTRGLEDSRQLSEDDI